MYKTIKELNIGDKVTIFDFEGYSYTREEDKSSGVHGQNRSLRVIAKDKYADNTVTLLAEIVGTERFHDTYGSPYQTWIGSSLQKRCENFFDTLPGHVKEVIVPASLYNDYEMDYGPLEKVSVLSVNEMYSREQFEDQFSLFIERYNDEAYIGQVDFAGRDFWTRTPWYRQSSFDGIYASAFFYSKENDKWSGGSRLHGADNAFAYSFYGFRPFFTVSGDAYVTENKLYHHYSMYGVGEENMFGYIKTEGDLKRLIGTKSFREREWN